jgi:acyl-coenzyme A thioesterase PaaI-like protein
LGAYQLGDASTRAAIKIAPVPESWATRRMRWGFNLFPAYRGTGARVTYIAADWREVRVALPLSWRTRNYVGTIFGGSLYGAVDPMYMIMLIRILGPGYTVWDKAATIRFLKPGRSTLSARFLLEDAETDEIRRRLESEPSVDRVYSVELKDEDGVTHAAVEKTVYIRKNR